jgi:hypothetical protein
MPSRNLLKIRYLRGLGRELFCYEKSRAGKKLRVEIQLSLNLNHMAKWRRRRFKISKPFGAGKSRFAVKRELGIQCFGSDAEEPGRLSFVALAGGERFFDCLPLGLC